MDPVSKLTEDEPSKDSISLDERVKERWIKQMMTDYPEVDQLMCSVLINQWCADPEYFDKLHRGELDIPKPLERNTEYCYKGVTVDPIKEKESLV